MRGVPMAVRGISHFDLEIETVSGCKLSLQLVFYHHFLLSTSDPLAQGYSREDKGIQDITNSSLALVNVRVRGRWSHQDYISLGYFFLSWNKSNFAVVYLFTNLCFSAYQLFSSPEAVFGCTFFIPLNTGYGFIYELVLIWPHDSPLYTN